MNPQHVYMFIEVILMNPHVYRGDSNEPITCLYVYRGNSNEPTSCLYVYRGDSNEYP